MGLHFNERQLPQKFSKSDLDIMFKCKNIGLNPVTDNS